MESIYLLIYIKHYCKQTREVRKEEEEIIQNYDNKEI